MARFAQYLYSLIYLEVTKQSCYLFVYSPTLCTTFIFTETKRTVAYLLGYLEGTSKLVMLPTFQSASPFWFPADTRGMVSEEFIQEPPILGENRVITNSHTNDFPGSPHASQHLIGSYANKYPWHCSSETGKISISLTSTVRHAHEH